MSNRRSVLVAEEGPGTPGSPLRRSTRIANSPAPAASSATSATVAPVSRRRSSATDSTPTTPAKLTRVKRPSLSHEIVLEERPQTPRAGRKSASAEPEPKPTTPAKGSRKASICKKADEVPTPNKVEPPSRRRSLRGQSTSPAKDTAPELPTTKLRGRRGSITQMNLEVIKETDTKTQPKKAAVGRSGVSTRRSSMDAAEESEPRSEEKKSVARRSIRGRSASLDVPDEPESKAALDLNPIIEEEAESDKSEKENEKEQKDDDIVVVKSVEEKHMEVEEEEEIAEQKTEENTQEVVERVADEDLKVAEDKELKKVEEVIVLDESEDEASAPTESIETDAALAEVAVGDGNAAQGKASPSTNRARKSLGALSPIRRSPRLSGSPVATPEAKSAKEHADVAAASSPVMFATPTKSPQSSPEKDQPVPPRTHRLSETLADGQSASNRVSSPRKSLRLSEAESAAAISAAAADIVDASPRRSLSLRLSEDDMDQVNKSTNSDDDDVVIIEKPRSNRSAVSPLGSADRVGENQVAGDEAKRKSNSFNETENTKVPSTRSAKSLSDGSALNTSNILNTSKAVVNTPNKAKGSVGAESVKEGSVLKGTPELINGSDDSFRFVLSVPTTNSIDLDGDAEITADDALNISGNSNASDKENVTGKLNITGNVSKSPMSKRASLTDTSTPKLNASLKVHSFCERVDGDFFGSAVIATAQASPKVAAVKSTGIAPAASISQGGSVIEVDNEDEFGSSPVKARKALAADVTQSDLVDELMNSFVDEVIEVDDADGEKDDKVEEVQQVNDKPLVGDVLREQDVLGVGAKERAKVDVESEVVKVAVEQETINLDSDQEKPEEETRASVQRCGSKRRKVVMHLDERMIEALDSLIASHTGGADEGSGSDGDSQSANEFIDDMAAEGEEDTPSEDSNQIVDDGESLHSYDDLELDSDDDYEKDSFVTDDEGAELLSGSEFDLEELDAVNKPKKEKKKRSRILQVVDSSDEEVADEKKEADAAVADASSPAKVEQDLKAENAAPVVVRVDDAKANKVTVLQDIKILPGAAGVAEPGPVVINEEDNLKSLEAMKDTLSVVVPREPKPSLSTPNNSMIESPGRRPRRKTSITISDQIKIGRHSDGEITDKITKAVDFFVSSIKEKSGSVSLNVSLDFANNSSSADEASPRRQQRASLRQKQIDVPVEEVPDATLRQDRSGTKEAKASPSSSVDTKANESPGVKKKKKRSIKKAKVLPEVKQQEQLEATPGGLNESVPDAAAVVNRLEKRRKKKLDKSIEVEEGEVMCGESPKKKAKLHKKANKEEVRTSGFRNVEATDLNVAIPKEKLDLKEKRPFKKSVADAVLDCQLRRKITKDIACVEKGMKVEDAVNESVSKSELPHLATAGIDAVGTKKRKMKLIAPSKTNCPDYGAWSVEKAETQLPSRRNRGKVTVKTQLEAIRGKLAANDFKNQMIYGSHVKRMDSKEMLQNKQKAGFAKRKRK